MIVIFLFWVVFAILAEINQKNDAYKSAILTQKETSLSLKRKLTTCLTAEQRTIKWRRVYLGAVASVALMYIFVHNRVPSPRELVVSFFIIYIVYMIIWEQYYRTVTTKVVDIGKEIISRLNDGKVE